ncbi:MAG TPA: ATP-binding protein, partial [Casimicrobiaceae bacterium]|nr:ATP-binding protein [Casimicrobiaceae bacterium]
GKLRSLALIERTDGAGEAPEQRQTFKLARRVLALAYGELALGSELAGFARELDDHPRLEDLELAKSAVSGVANALAGGASLIVVHGRIGTGRRSLLAGSVERPILLVDGRAISAKLDQARAQLRTVAREARLLARVPLIQHLDALAASGDTPDRLGLIERELDGVVLATSIRPIARCWTKPVVQVELPPLSGAACKRVWARALPPASDSDTDHLATIYPLSPALIFAAGAAARVASGASPMRAAHIEAGIRSVLDARLAGLATRVAVSQSWDDLVLPDDQLASIAELIARIRERRVVYEQWGFADKVGRGLGVAALLSGPPGTGKTMAAGLVARELGCELYQVDTSKIASKWIGETEKNLAALFDAAEAGHAILLFDEADSLFAKRTEVQSSNDRHANQEVNYLLQRLESYTGVCILTTNHDSAIDEAFRRRLAVHIRFPLPEADERARLWRALLPAGAPTEGALELDAIAQLFAMSGGHIRNAVVRAAFLAADERTAIGDDHLVRAARIEYEAMGKIAVSCSTATASWVTGNAR